VVFLRLSTICLIFAVDAVVALTKGDNMYTLKPTGTGGTLATALSLTVATALLFASPRGRWLRERWARRYETRRMRDL
jgi:hypothetical protein